MLLLPGGATLVNIPRESHGSFRGRANNVRVTANVDDREKRS